MKDLKFLKLIEYFADKFKIHYDDEDKYYSSLMGIKKYIKENEIVLSTQERTEVLEYIRELNVPFECQNIFRILNPDADIEEIGVVYDLNEYRAEMLNDTMLLKFLISVLSTVTYNQNGNLLLLKYNVTIWSTGFHNLAKWCRGKIVDLDNGEVVSYPFDKFFNLNEVPETKDVLVKSWIKESDYVVATDKIDGSTIIVSLYKSKPLITTNGSFENDQTKWAKELFDKQYPNFLANAKEGYTYIFELVHPENRIVLDYHGEKALYLLNIRDLSTKKLMPLHLVHSVAEQFGFPVPEVYNFNDLETMVELAHTMRGANKEGWVIRIGVGEHEYIVKLKLEEYFAMHKAFGKVKLGWVYKHMANGDLDDFIAICTDEQKNEIFNKIDIINSVREKIKNKTIAEAETYLQKYGVNHEKFFEDKEKMVQIINEALKSRSNVKHFVVKYLKDPVKLELSIQKIFYKNMKMFFEEFGENVNE